MSNISNAEKYILVLARDRKLRKEIEQQLQLADKVENSRSASYTGGARLAAAAMTNLALAFVEVDGDVDPANKDMREYVLCFINELRHAFPQAFLVAIQGLDTEHPNVNEIISKDVDDVTARLKEVIEQVFSPRGE